MALANIKSGTLGAFNVGLATGVAGMSAGAAAVVPLGAQVDALIASGLGPFQADMSAQLNAALAASADLSVSVSNPYAGIQAVLASLANIQQALTAALSLPPEPVIQYSTQLSTLMALSGTLSAQLGALQQAISQATNIKTATLRQATDLVTEAGALSASMSAGPAFFFDFSGPLGGVGAEIGSLFAGGLVDGSNVIAPSQQVYGVVLLSSVPSVQTALNAIITAPP